MDSGFSNMLENTRKYFQGIPSDAAAAAAQLHFAPPLPPSHHLLQNGGGSGRTPMSTSSSSSSSSAEPSSATATDRFAGYHHPHLQRYNYQPYTSPGHYPRTAVDPKPAAFQHQHFQPPSLQQYHHHQLPPSSSSSSTSSSSSSPYKSPFQLQPPPPPPPAVKQQQPPPLTQSPFKPAAARASPPTGKQYSPAKPSPYAVVSKPSPYAVVPKPTTTAPQPQSPFTAPKEQHTTGLQQPSVPETPPPTPHSSQYYNRTTLSSSQQQQAIDRDYLRFKPIQTPPPPPSNRFQPLERPKSEVPTGATGPQSSHLAIRYDPKLEQPRSGVRAVPIAQAKQPSSSAAASHENNRVIVQKPEPRYHQQPQQQQQQPPSQQQQHLLNHRSSDDHHLHKRPASVQPSYLDSRPFQIKPYDGGSNSSNGSSSNGSSGQSSSYHRPFAQAPPTAPPTSSQSSPAVVVAGMDHRWTVFGRQDARTPTFLQQPPSSAAAAAAAAAAVINGYHHRQPPSSSSLPVVVSQHLQHQSTSMSSRQLPQQQQQQHYPLNLHKLTPPARPATAAGQLQQVKVGPENTTSASTKLRFEMKRESPLDLSVKTVCRSADSTDDQLNLFGHDIPKVNFKPDFNACRGLSTSLAAAGATVQPAQPTVVVGGGQQPQHNATAPTYHQMQAPPLSLPPPSPLPPPPVVLSSQQQQPLSSSTALPTPLPPVVHHQGPPLLQLSPADEAWRAAIDRQIEQKFSTYTSAKKQHHHHHHPHPLQLQHQQQHQHPQLPPVLQPQQQQQQGPAQADKRVLEILKQNIEARDQSSRPQIAEAPSTPAMVFSTPIRKEPSTTPLKKTDYYMAERTAVTPFPKKIDYYMDRALYNAPRIRTKAERKQVSAEGSSSGMRMSSPMAAATAISPHPFLPSNSAPQTKQDPIPITQTESVVDVKLDIKREPSPIKDPELCTLNKEDAEKDDDEDFWMNTCNSFVVQLTETQEKKKVKTPVKRKLPKEQLPQPPKRKYTKRIKIEPISESEQGNKIPVFKGDVLKKPKEEVKSEKSALQEKMAFGDKPEKMESLDMDKENKTKEIDQEKTTDGKEKEDNEKETTKMKPKRKRIFKLKFPKPLLVNKVKKMKKEDKKELKMKKEAKKEEKKELKKGEKKETIKKDILLQKMEKKELAAAAKEEKKGLKKEEKRDLKKDPQNKKDLIIKKENKKAEGTRKKVAAEKENVTKNNDNTTRRSAAAAAAAAINEVAGKFNPRQSLRRKNSLKDYTFAFDELLDDAFAHFDEIPVKATAAAVVIKKPKEKDNSESTRMKLRSRSRPSLTKQEPLLAAKKKANAKNKNIPKRRRKKSLGEKSVATANDWKDELYKFKRSLRLPSKLISVVSPPSAVGPDQVSLTSIMNIPPLLKPAKVPKSVKSTSQSPTTAAAATVAATAAAGKNKTKRLGHLFGRRDVFKGRRLLKREKIVSAEKLLQRNLRKRRQQEDEEKKGCAGEEATADLPDDEDVNVEVDGEDDDDDDNNKNGKKPPARIFFKRKFMRKKFRSGFDYIKKKKKKEPASEKKPVSVPTAATSMPLPKCAPRFVSEIQADIKVWIVNKGHGETVLHRAARLGVKDVVGFCIEKLGYAPSVADNAGYTPLHEACSQGHYHIAKLLLQFGADVSASAQGGIRPLHEAVENGDVHLVRLLLGYGADPRLATYSGQSPLSLATDRQTRMLLEHHVNDIQGYGNASVWNFDESTLNDEPEDVDRLLWCCPPQLSADDGPSFEFEFADQPLPDVYKLSADGDGDATPADGDGDAATTDDWVLFSDVSAALSVKTADALAKLLDVENAVTAVPLDRFNERAVPRKTLGRQPAVVAAANKTVANKTAAEPSAATTTSDAAADEVGAGGTEQNAATPAAAGEQILLVRFDHKLKQLLGVDAYSVS